MGVSETGFFTVQVNTSNIIAPKLDLSPEVYGYLFVSLNEGSDPGKSLRNMNEKVSSLTINYLKISLNETAGELKIGLTSKSNLKFSTGYRNKTSVTYATDDISDSIPHE